MMLNFHHFRYFWEVARDGNLSRTARRLRVSQSALSSQIRQLEDSVGQALFDRVGRRLVLTEAGNLALSYAEKIFHDGEELLSTLQKGKSAAHTLSVGAVSTLSRNFQRLFLGPLMRMPELHLRLVSGSLNELLGQLEAHRLELILSNRPLEKTEGGRFRSRRLARQPVSLVASKPMARFRFPQGLSGHRMILPGTSTGFRSDFDALVERLGISLQTLAEVDDMAMIRLLALESGAVALVPSIVVRDELKQKRLHEWCVVPDVFETFYAISLQRKFEHPLLKPLLERSEAALLAHHNV